MITITINEEACNRSEMADALREIAKRIDNGNTSGYYPTFQLQGEEEDDIDNEEKSFGDLVS